MRKNRFLFVLYVFINSVPYIAFAFLFVRKKINDIKTKQKQNKKADRKVFSPVGNGKNENESRKK